jgi:oxygen-independent coproporphyrinogen-3 oxidase
LLHIAEKLRGCVAEKIPYSVEVSPSTVSEEKLRLLRQFGVTRISIGVQTFAPQETAFLDRPQSPEIVARALQSIRNINFSVLNIDLMYGLPGQTRESWRNSLHSALTWRPEEIFLYPLYVRPLTGLAEHPEEHEGTPVEAYREGRDLLLAAGYTQISMRMFRLSAAAPQDYPPYCCQEDGMVGIGCGARSYTRNLHYSTPYAVTARNVANLIDQYSSCTAESFDWADFGFYLDSEDQRRRYVLLSLLEHEGLTVPDYLARFDSHPLTDLPELILLTQHGLMNASSDCLRLTANGLERSDAIGPWLYSDKVRQLLEEYSPC